MKTDAEYVAKPQHCPCCDSDQVEGDSVDVYGDGEATQDVKCLTCNAKWLDVYNLVGFQIDEQPIT